VDKRDFKGIDTLLAAGVDINAVFSKGLTMMQGAVRSFFVLEAAISAVLEQSLHGLLFSTPPGSA